MKTRVIAGVLIAAMTTQNVALAEGVRDTTDRTKDIGEVQISEAEAKIIQLRMSLDNLDGALMQAEAGIKEKRDEGSTKRTLSVAAAGVSVGLSAVAYLAFSRVKGMPEVNKVAISVIGSTAAAIASAILGEKSEDSRTMKVDSAALATKIDDARAAALTLDLNGDPMKLKKRDELISALKEIKTSVSEVNDKSEHGHQIRFLTQTMQLLGALGTLLVPSTQSSGLAPLVYNAANLLLLLNSATPDSTEKLLKEMGETRKKIKSASLNLMAQK